MRIANRNVTALNAHITKLQAELFTARADAANLRNEIKLMDHKLEEKETLVKKLDHSLAELKELLAAKDRDLATYRAHFAMNKPEDRSGLGAKYEFVERNFKPIPIVPYPDPVEIVAHGLRIKIEKV